MALGDAERCVMSYRRPETIMKPEPEANKSEATTPVGSGTLVRPNRTLEMLWCPVCGHDDN
jgi:hypothetical protein